MLGVGSSHLHQVPHKPATTLETSVMHTTTQYSYSIVATPNTSESYAAALSVQHETRCLVASTFCGKLSHCLGV